MPTSEYGNNLTEPTNLKTDVSESPVSPPDSPVNLSEIAQNQPEESPMEIMERFIEQDQELGHEAELFKHLKPPEDHSRQTSAELIEKQELVRILEDARDKGIPHSLLESLWDLRNCHPEDVEEVPLVREHALSDVIRPMWEQGLDHELKNDLLFDLEGEEATEKLYVPQSEVEIENPQNLYQLVRKACDQNRMEELLTMIEENDDALIGETLEAAVARHREEIDRSFRENGE
jgi:hypothetical protein